MSLFGGKREDDHGSSRDVSAAAPTPAARPSGERRPAFNQEGGSVANIGKSIAIRGDLTGNEDMVIDGQVEGKVELPNNQLTVGADGKIKAEIHAKAVVVVGHVIGNVYGAERVEIQTTGRVEGDVAAPKLVVAEGAQINGAIQMTQKGTRAASTPEVPAAPHAAGVRKAG